MSCVLFSPDDAEALNRQVQKEIAPHLFLFCNYNPDTVRAFSTDAKYFKAVHNLYKLVTDASIAGQAAAISEKANVDFDTKKWNHYKGLAGDLRTAVAHNTSEKNGAAVEEQRYLRWLKETSGKTEMQCAADYEKPLLALEQLAQEVMTLLTNWVNTLAKVQNKEPMVKAWEAAILTFYTKPTNLNIFKSQLTYAYYATHPRRGNNAALLNMQLGEWLKERYYLPRCLSEEERSMMRNIEGLLSRLSPEGRRSVLQKRQELVQKQETAIRRLEKELAGTKAFKLSMYLNHYLRPEAVKEGLERQMPAVHESLKRGGRDVISMLPHDLMYQVIAEDLNM